MSPLSSSACLLLMLCHPLVSCGKIPSFLSRDREFRLGREDHPHPGQTVRRPRIDPGKLTSVLDVSDDVDQIADTEGEYTGASLTKPGMPPDFTLCGAFRTEAWITAFSSAYLFTLYGKDSTQWGNVNMGVAFTYTQYQVYLGHVYTGVTTTSLWFPLTWTRVCVSLDTVSGSVILVINGQVLEEKVHQEGLLEDLNRPSNLTITLGSSVDGWGFGHEDTGQFSDLNIFSSPLSTARMVAMTTAGSQECGAPGDFISWEEEVWTLHSQVTCLCFGELTSICQTGCKYFLANTLRTFQVNA